MVLEAPFFWQALTFGWMLKANLGTEVATEYHQFAQRKKRQGDVEGEGSGEGERKKEEKKRKKNKLTWTFCLLARASRVHASSPVCILCFCGCLFDPLFGERPVADRLPLFKTKTQPKTPRFPSLPPSLVLFHAHSDRTRGVVWAPSLFGAPCCRMFEDGLLNFVAPPSHRLVLILCSLSHLGCLGKEAFSRRTRKIAVFQLFFVVLFDFDKRRKTAVFQKLFFESMGPDGILSETTAWGSRCFFPFRKRSRNERAGAIAGCRWREKNKKTQGLIGLVSIVVVCYTTF